MRIGQIKIEILQRKAVCSRWAACNNVGDTQFPHFEGVVQAADKAIDALRRMRAGIKADRNKKRPIKDDVSSLLRGRKSARVDKKPVWKHKLFCFAHKDQD